MESFFDQYGSILLIVATVWTLPWKGVSLWKAAKNGDKAWFVILLILNTLAILDILYIFVFSKRKRLGSVKSE